MGGSNVTYEDRERCVEILGDLDLVYEWLVSE
jgi:hypothetical protein